VVLHRVVLALAGFLVTAATLKAVDALPNLLMLAPVVSLQPIDAVVDLCLALTHDGAEETDGEENGETGKDDDRGNIEVDVHVSIVPCVWGRVK